jgi:hypothetical protein
LFLSWFASQNTAPIVARARAAGLGLFGFT